MAYANAPIATASRSSLKRLVVELEGTSTMVHGATTDRTGGDSGRMNTSITRHTKSAGRMVLAALYVRVTIERMCTNISTGIFFHNLAKV